MTLHRQLPAPPDAPRSQQPRQWARARGLPLRIGREALLRRLLALADLTAALLAVLSIGILFGTALDKSLWAAVFLPTWVVLAKLHGLYDRDQRALRHLTVDELPSLFMWATSGTAVLALVLIAMPSGSLSGGSALRVWAIAGATAFVLRALVRAVWRRLTPPDASVVIGRGPLAEAVKRKLELFPDIHVRVASERDTVTHEELDNDAEWLDGIDRILLASQSLDEGLIRDLVVVCRARQIRLSIVPPARGLFGTAVQLNHIADLPVLEYSTWHVSRSTLLLKRVMDVMAAGPILVLLAPVGLLIALAVRLDDGSPVVFRQRRAGLNGEPFWMYKFRTMFVGAEHAPPDLVSVGTLYEPIFKPDDDPRVTRVGRFLRRTSLDELPQLVNVLLGHMSLVGPRPEQVEVVARYRPEHRFRLSAKPGLTGPMQVFGRGQLTLEERLAVEREYIENMSLQRDLHVLAHTVSAVFLGRGAY